MKLDFLDSKYGLQIVYLLFLSVVGSAIFSAISVALSSLIYGVSLIDIQDFDKLLTHPNARNIILLMLVLQTFGMIILPVIVFVKTVINQPKLDLKLNFNFPSFYYFTILFFAISGLIFVGFLGEINEKIPISEFLQKAEEGANNTAMFIVSANGIWNFIVTVILLSIVPAIGEELFFRGIMQKLFAKTTKNNLLAVLITATIFSAFHFQFQTFLPRLFMGILLGYLLIWSGSIIISMIAHFLHNFLTLVIAKYNESSNIPELEETNYIALMISIMVLSSLSYLYYNNYKKNNSALIE